MSDTKTTNLAIEAFSDPESGSVAWPTLYKKSETDAIVTWNIRVDRDANGQGVIVTSWGQEGGAVQETSDTVKFGKNIGKKNETTALAQACAEAQSKWEKQQKNKKYVTTRQAALAGEREAEFVTGGIDPMLAFPLEKKPKALQFPCDVQPKLDGHRCIAIVHDGTATLWSRTRKPINSVPHIVAALESAFQDENVVLDGELYNHDYRDHFEDLTSFIRSGAPKEGHEAVEYHIYDTVRPGAWHERRDWLETNIPVGWSCLVLVETSSAENREVLDAYFRYCLESGYEGAMVRNQDGEYEHKRSANLLKVKEMDDAEFPVMDVVEGRGKDAGHAIFVCQTERGQQFQCRMVGRRTVQADYFKKRDSLIGKTLTVKFQNWTEDGLPRFPIALRFREDV